MKDHRCRLCIYEGGPSGCAVAELAYWLQQPDDTRCRCFEPKPGLHKIESRGRKGGKTLSLGLAAAEKLKQGKAIAIASDDVFITIAPIKKEE